MIINNGELQRNLLEIKIESDLVVVGGGLSGVCCALAAARQGLKVALIQDRPVLGGNASSEVRLWVLGATSHMGNNNRWAREGGVVDGILVENMYRNPEGNPLIFDAIVLEKVYEEKNISLFLNTAVYAVNKKSKTNIDSVIAYCSQNQTQYIYTAPLFCDASGDGILGFLAGAAFRMGAESKEEFGELFAPSRAYGELLGHSLYFYSKRMDKPVRYVAPSFALKDISVIPRYKSFNADDFGCRLWWIEYGGRMDTIHDTEKIKWELWKIVYSVWDHIKNSGLFPDAANHTLEWVGTIPGKRESRRFEGDYILRQQDIIEQRSHDDAVAYGGWSIDLHPADGIFSELPGCNQWHSKGIYTIPYRCLYSKNINNLFLAGRIISSSHVAFGSTRVMGTAAYAAQVVGTAAKICLDKKVEPRSVAQYIQTLQKKLIKSGHHIPGVQGTDEEDCVQKATISASSEYSWTGFPQDHGLLPLSESFAQLIPAGANQIPEICLNLAATEATTVQIELYKSARLGNFTPDVVLEEKSIKLSKGENFIQLSFSTTIAEPQYLFLILRRNKAVSLFQTSKRLTGILSLFQTQNKAVSNNGAQTPPDDIGVEQFEFWVPKRRPDGFNMALSSKQALHFFAVENIRNGIARPFHAPNAWVADPADDHPKIILRWNETKVIRSIIISFDTDFDHPMESVLQGHPESVMPFCVRNYRIYSEKNEVIFQKEGNYQTRNEIILDKPLHTNELIFEFEHPDKNIPASVFEIRCYA